MSDQDQERAAVPVSPLPNDDFWRTGSPPAMTPTQQTPRDFPLDTVQEDSVHALVTPSLSADACCPCGPDCKQPCCQAKWPGIRGSLARKSKPTSFQSEGTRMLSPVKNTSPSRSTPSPTASYGSLDDGEPLVPNHQSDVVVSV